MNPFKPPVGGAPPMGPPFINQGDKGKPFPPFPPAVGTFPPNQNAPFPNPNKATIPQPGPKPLPDTFSNKLQGTITQNIPFPTFPNQGQPSFQNNKTTNIPNFSNDPQFQVYLQKLGETLDNREKRENNRREHYQAMLGQ